MTMRHILPVSYLVLALAAVPLAAQDKPGRSPAPARSDGSKPVVLSGCLTGGPSSYTLSNVAVTRVAHETADRPVATSGASTSYSLTPRDGVELGDYVGKKVEVTGMLMAPVAPPKATGAASKASAHDSLEAQAQARATIAASTDPKIAATSVKLLSATCQ
jgi:hypothetical protein